MSIRKPADYSELYLGVKKLLTQPLLQIELYCKIGSLIYAQSEKGTAVAASDYLQSKYA